MGWYGDRDKRPVSALVAELVREYGLSHHVLVGHVLYGTVVVGATAPPQYRNKRIVMVLKLDPGLCGVWSYKPMDETVGPYVDTCPASVLDAADPPLTPQAAAFRARQECRR